MLSVLELLLILRYRPTKVSFLLSVFFQRRDVYSSMINSFEEFR